MRTTRIIKINDSNAELSESRTQIGINDAGGVETRCREEQVTNELKDVPPKQLFNYNLKQLKSFKKIRQSYKLKNLKYTFLSDMKVVLNEYLPTDKDNQYNDELLIEVLNTLLHLYLHKRIFLFNIA